MTRRRIDCFKAYDIRGRLGIDLDEDVAWRAWSFELAWRLRWHAASRALPIVDPAARPGSLVRGSHARALSALVERLDAGLPLEATGAPERRLGAAARAFELVAIADPASLPPARARWLLSDLVVLSQGSAALGGAVDPEAGRRGLARMSDGLRVGLPVEPASLDPGARELMLRERSTVNPAVTNGRHDACRQATRAAAPAAASASG